MASRSFVLLGVGPIPVGHRVEVYILSRDVGVFGADVQPQPEEPLLRDVETGIHYGRTWHLERQDGEWPADGLTKPRTAKLAVPLAERIEGRVTACFVVSEGVHNHQASATTVVVEIEGDATFR